MFCLRRARLYDSLHRIAYLDNHLFLDHCTHLFPFGMSLVLCLERVGLRRTHLLRSFEGQIHQGLF